MQEPQVVATCGTYLQLYSLAPYLCRFDVVREHSMRDLFMFYTDLYGICAEFMHSLCSKYE
jgi:hypothetical protein